MFLSCAYKPNFVFPCGMIAIYLGLKLLPSSSDSPPQSGGTILHTRKDFAVSPPLKELVSVRTSTLAGDGYYPLRLIST